MNGVVLLTHETVMAAIDESAPAPVISAALYDRFSSRGEADFADKLLSAIVTGSAVMRKQRLPRREAPDERPPV